VVPFLDLTRQYRRIKDDILSATERIYEKGHFILGEEVSAFEKEFSYYCGVRCGVGVGSGTDALYVVSYSYSLSEGFWGIET
jgi:dTDP-4-amino-4,6-dideoxygalactose transaminase